MGDSATEDVLVLKMGDGSVFAVVVVGDGEILRLRRVLTMLSCSQAMISESVFQTRRSTATVTSLFNEVTQKRDIGHDVATRFRKRLIMRGVAPAEGLG